jgi:hypothetical protein
MCCTRWRTQGSGSNCQRPHTNQTYDCKTWPKSKKTHASNEFRPRFASPQNASSRSPALSPAGRGISRAPPLHSAPDPSLRLKNGFAQDDASEKTAALATFSRRARLTNGKGGASPRLRFAPDFLRATYAACLAFFARSSNSLGETSSTCVATPQRCPKGS